MLLSDRRVEAHAANSPMRKRNNNNTSSYRSFLYLTDRCLQPTACGTRLVLCITVKGALIFFVDTHLDVELDPNPGSQKMHPRCGSYTIAVAWDQCGMTFAVVVTV